MIFKYIQSIVLLVGLLCWSGCRHSTTTQTPVERCFYYWKSVFEISPAEAARLQQLHVTKLYIKYFDVSINPNTGKPAPVASIRFQNQPPSYRVTPVVFITNATMQALKWNEEKMLAQHIVDKVYAINEHIGLASFDELQIDCDWNLTTKEKYFHLLADIKALLHGGQKLSATIRLHQIKYYTQCGVPPVDIGMLMCYNVENIALYSTPNAIINPETVKKYINEHNTYPIPLDIGLPIFSWGVCFQNKQPTGLINNLTSSILKKEINIKHISRNWYLASNNLKLLGIPVAAGTHIRLEESSRQFIAKSATLCRHLLTNQPGHVILFHLDSIPLNNHSHEELENLYHIFER